MYAAAVVAERRAGKLQKITTPVPLYCELIPLIPLVSQASPSRSTANLAFIHSWGIFIRTLPF